MSGVGSQTGGFNSPHIPVKSTDSKPQQGGAAIAQVNSGSSPNPAVVTHSPAKQLLNEQTQDSLSEKVFERQQDTKRIHQEVDKQRAGADSFQARTAAGTSREAQQHGAKFAGNINKEKELQRAQRLEFVNRVQNTPLTGNTTAKAAIDMEEAPSAQKEQAVAHAVQSQIESIDSDNKKNKKIESKLSKIFSEGGDKGKGFVAFVRREMEKGPLSDSITELVDGFYETLRGSALTASEMIEQGDEPLITLRGIVAVDNIEEQVAMQNSLANSVINSAGERSDLMLIRNKMPLGTKISPPKANHGSKPNKVEKAVEFVSSINKGSLFAPWDTASLVA
jgi:uncharacterized membrane protein